MAPYGTETQVFMNFKKMFLSGRSVASESAPSVALEVQTFSRLPSPPYETEESAKRGKKPKIIEPMAVKVVVGHEYDFITTGVIARIRVEKIWQEKDGETYVVVSQKVITGSQQGRLTHAIHISEFKQRVIAGGIESVVI